MARAIDLLIDEIIPQDIRGDLTDLSGSNLNSFLVNLYTKYPERYVKVSHDLARLGSRAAYIQGETLGLEDFDPVIDKPVILASMNAEIDQAKKKLGNTDQFKKARESIWVKYNDIISKTTASGAKALNNRIGHSIISGARGKPAQMQAMLSTPGLYADSKGDIVPMFVENSFADGLRPLEFAAGSFGARASVISTKAATAKGGDYGKLLSQASSRLVVTEDDCGVDNGLAYDIDDSTARDRFLARDTGGFKAGTLLTRNVLADLKSQGNKKIVARSPLTCNADGLCAKCVGKNFEKKFAKVGDHVGITSANALSEPVTQGALCLAEGTQVRMADGTSKEIEKIKAGDHVLSADKKGNTFSTLVKNTFNQGPKTVYITSFENNTNIGCTLDHKFLVSENVVDALGATAEVLTTSGLVKVLNHSLFGKINCYDIEVDHPDHLFVLANNLIVSNSAKHTGGQATQNGEYGGFEILSQFVQSPKEYMHKAITADEDGQVSNIETAPQGGFNVSVNNKTYYIKPEYPLTVKVGQHIEAGTPLSSGIIDARDVVEKVGLGAGRKYWADRVQKIYKDSGLYADKKNLEIVAKGTLDTMNLDEDIDGLDAYMDDTVSYNKLKKSWKPENVTKQPTEMATNRFLAKDTLEHTIGTRITPSIQNQFKEVGIDEIETTDKKPPFSPNMDRLRTASHYNDDWLAGLSTSYLKKQLEEGALRAATTNIEANQHWAPRVAVGVGFGQNIKTTGKF